MPRFDKLKGIDTNVDKREFAIVAVSRVGGHVFLIDYEGFSMDLDVQESGLSAEDMGLGPQSLHSPGLWIGEGVPVWVPTGSMDGYPDESEYEATYKGFRWRRPTPDEVNAMNMGKLWGRRKRCIRCGEFLEKGKELTLQVRSSPEEEPEFQKFCTKCYEKELEK